MGKTLTTTIRLAGKLDASVDAAAEMIEENKEKEKAFKNAGRRR